jgi:hypothetical protein
MSAGLVPAVGDTIQLGKFQHHAVGLVVERYTGGATVAYYVPAELAHDGVSRMVETGVIFGIGADGNELGR